MGDRTVGRNRETPRATALAQALARTRADIWLAAIEAVLIVVAYSAALSLRFLDGGASDEWWRRLMLMMPIIVIVHLGTNVAFGNYGHVWEYASINEAVRIVAGSATAGALLLSGGFVYRYVTAESLVPTSTILIGSLLTVGGMGALRFWSRLFSRRKFGELMDELTTDVTLIVGTGKAAADLSRHHVVGGRPMRVIGFVAPDGVVHSRKLAGLPILGTVDCVPRLIGVNGITQIVIAAPNADELARRLVDLTLHTNVQLRIVPHIDDALSSRQAVRDVRDLELTDLLPRPTVETDLEAVQALLQGKKVLVTGAGGSIGSELVRQILDFGPEVVIALDNDETHLYEAGLDWSSDGSFEYVLADIRDLRKMELIMEEHRPEVVFHAAAHKHVPILESCPEEAFKTNVAGTANLLEMCRRYDVERFVLISTDKAVSPTSAMGASKRLAEMLVQVESKRPDAGLYCAVRFGNVLGSRGSVVPTFTRQIQHGGPVTVSHPDMERYFMTVQEAVELVLQAATLAKGGDVFVLDMGEPVKIIDLAHRLIRLAGLVPDKDIPVVISGRRPGEKLREVLAAVPLIASEHPKIRMAIPGHPPAVTLMDAMMQLRRLAESGDSVAVKELLRVLAKETWNGEEIIDLRAPADEPFVASS